MYKIQTLNNISVKGLRRLPRETYEVASEIGHPDAILVRSANMHEMDIPDTVHAIGRAGAGTNNIPITAMSERGVPVFNAPGANANAVKELVLASLFVAARNIKGALAYVDALEGSDAEVSKAVEAGKKRYAGHELPGRRLGVIGLGAIGVEVCNAALALGMEVVGYDPHMTVRRAWQLSAGVEEATSVEHLLGQVDVVCNLARGGIVDDAAVVAALDEGKLGAYVTDFPNRTTIGHERILALPHLGASTAEAEENCAVMVADTVRDYLENGNIRHSVNFPDAKMPRVPDTFRITVANRNVPNMVGQISTILADAGLNIADLLNKSRGELAYTIVDLDGEASEATLAALAGVEGVLDVRVPGS